MTVLQPTRTQGRLTGFGNLFSRESRKWWHTRRWWMQALIWLVIINGFVFFGLFVMPGLVDESNAQLEETGTSTANMTTGEEFKQDVPNAMLGLAALALPVGVIILTQSQVLGEKRSGVAAWILSKPVARPAYLLAKLLADAAGILLIMVVFQLSLAYLVMASVLNMNLGDYLLATGLLVILVLFYQSFTLMMSALGKSTEIVLGASFGVLLGGLLLKDALASVLDDLVFLTPWAMSDVISVVIKGNHLSGRLLWPVITTPLLTVLCLSVMFWQFRRQEL